ncbi:hypothetical protein FOXB_15577, partial [Fusarium oxysporum f. sp. conglutinans Fo5176]
YYASTPSLAERKKVFLPFQVPLPMIAVVKYASQARIYFSFPAY